MIEQQATNVGQFPPVEAELTGNVVVDTSVTPGNPSRRGAGTFRAIMRNRKALIGVIILLGFAGMAIFAPWIAPGDPNDLIAKRNLPPSSEYWFGTTGSGQDVFAQTVWGARASLGVGVAVGIFTTFLAALIGMTAGYFGGKVDDFLSLFMNVFLIIPALPLLIVLVGFLGGGGPMYFVFILGITGWSWGARVLRSQTLSLREKDFVSAAEVSGESRIRIIGGEIFPNMISLVAANLFGATIYAVGAMAALQFLGLGNVSLVSWGTNLYWAQNNGALLTGAWWTYVPSGLAIALVAFAFALTNFAVDEVTNPRLKAQRVARESLAKLGHKSKKNSRATPVIRHAN